MSYSFGVKGSSKADAGTKVRDKLVEVVTAQPVHAIDCDAAQAAAELFIALLPDDDTKDITVTVHGSVYKIDAGLQQASVSVSASLVNRL